MSRQSIRTLSVSFLSVSLCALMALTGCGGSPTPTVALSSTVMKIDQGQSVTITAATTDAAPGSITAHGIGQGVTWSLSPSTGCGTLSSITTTSVIYTAPSSVSTPTQCTITATSIQTSTINTTITITVYPSPTITTTTGAFTTSGGGMVGTPYSFTLSNSGGVSPYSWSVQSGALPAGLTLNSSTGVISGTPTAAGPSTFTLQLADSGTPPITATIAGSILIAPAPAIVFGSPTLPTATVGTTYSGSVSATGGAGTITYALASGSLPAGLTLNANGTITGTLTTPLPTAPAISNFTVTATDGYHDSLTSSSYSITSVYPTLSITSSGALSSGIVGTAYPGATLAATGGNGTYNSWSVSPSNALSQYGLSINATTGVISGTPSNVTGVTTDTFTAKLTDSYGDTATSANLSITLYPALSITTASTLPNGEVGTAYSGAITATGGSGTYTNFQVISGTALSEAGLTLNPTTGAITGTPATGTAESNATVTIQVTDSVGNKISANFTLTIYAGLAITTTATLPSGINGGTYSPINLAAAGGSGNYTWSVNGSNAALSNVGLQLSSAGVISLTGASFTGSETAATVSIKVTDTSTTLTATQTFTLTIYPAITYTSTTLSSGLVNTAYSGSVATATGGSGSFTYQVIGGTGLSAVGLSLSSSGTISGTPTGTETGGQFTVLAKDSNNDTATATYFLTIYPTLSFTSAATLSPAEQGTTYIGAISATGGSGSGYTYQVTGGTGLSAVGLALNSNGTINGTPSGTETAGSFTVKVTDSSSETFSQNFSLTVYSALSFSTGTLPTGIVNAAYTGSIPAATGGSGNYSYQVISGGGLSAAGLSLSTSGSITGTPTGYETAGPFTVKVTDTTVPTATTTANFTITIYPALSFTGTTLTGGLVNTAYTGSIPAATGGSGSGYTYTVTGGTGLSAVGLSLSTSGAITGTPTATETAGTFTVQAKDSANNTTTATFTITIYGALAITTGTTLPSGIVGTTYPGATLTAVGGSGTGYTYQVTGGTGLSTPGLSLSSGGSITGTPTNSETNASVTIKVTDSLNNTASQTFAITIYPALTYTGTMLTSGLVNTAYTGSVATATGGSGSFTYSVTGGTGLSAVGLSLSSSGAITGTPSTTETSGQFTVQAKDSNNDTTTANFILTIYPTITFTTSPTLTSGEQGISYTNSIVATGGSGSGYTYQVTGGTGLSAVGLSLSSSGSITGTPSGSETSGTFTVKVTDSANNTNSQTYTLTIYPQLSFTTGTLPTGIVNGAYSGSIPAATGGSGNYSYSVTGGTGLSAVNLSLSTSGAITGTPNTTETAVAFSVKVTDTTFPAATATANFTMTVYPALYLGNTYLRAGIVGTYYTNNISGATGGSGTGYTYSVTNGTGLSAVGLSLSSNGTITGTPSASETNGTFTVQLKDSANNTTTANFYITIYPQLIITTTSLPSGTNGTFYSFTPTATGGSGTYSGWLPTSGNFCLSNAGLSFNTTTGTISGTPNVSNATTCYVSFQVTDTFADTATSTSLALNLYTGVTITTPTTLPSGIVNSSYSQTLTSAGGSGTGYTYQVTGGTGLSAVGLSLSSSGTISGTPTTTETNGSVTIKVTDSANNTSSQTFSISVYGALSFTTSTTLPTGIQGTAYSQSIVATGGSGSGYTYQVTGGTGLSAVGLSLGTNGSITGTPNSSETAATFTVKVTDSANNTASQTFSLTIYNTLQITTTSLPNGTVGVSYSTTPNATGGSGTYTNGWSLTSGSSCLTGAGLAFSTINGQITGTPTSSATCSLGLKVTDSVGNTATTTLSLTINYATPQITTTNLPSAVKSTFYTQTFAASSGSGNYTWTITTGQSALSAIGITMSTSGVLSGTPTATTNGIAFTVQVTDTTSNLTSTAPYTFIVNSAAAPVCSNSGLNNAILNGHYAFFLGGFDPSGNNFYNIGSFKADGSGNITNGLGDTLGNQNSTLYNSGTTGAEQSYTFTGTASIGNSSSDTRGLLTLTNGSTSSTGLPATSTYCFTADSITSGVAYSGRIVETDGSGYVLSGYFEIQNNSDFTNAALGNSYAYGVQGVDGTGGNRKASIGQFTLNGSGGVTSGQLDFAGISNGSPAYTAAASVTTAGSSYSIASNGRGTLTLATGSGTLSFVVYVVESGTKLIMLSTSNQSQPVLAGQAVEQTTTSYTTANVAATGVFRSTGKDASNFAPAADNVQIGVITFDGAGNASGTYDQNDGGYVDFSNSTTNGIPNPSVLTGATYSVTSLGYLTLANAGNHPPNFYLYAPGSGFGLSNANTIDLFYMSQQTVPQGGFSTTNLNSTYVLGSYAVGTIPPQAINSGTNYPSVFDAVVSYASPNANGTTDSVTAPGTNNYVSVDQNFTNTYALDSTYGASTGRVIVNQAGSLNGIAYIVSPTTFFLMGAQSAKDGYIAQADQITSTSTASLNDGLTITTTAVNTATQGSSYSYSLSRSGGSGTPYTWSVYSGTGLSAVGLSLSSSGVITGTPTSTESAVPFTVKLTDGSSDTAYLTLYMTVIASGGSGNTITGSISIPNYCGGTPTIPAITLSINTSPVQTTTSSNGTFTFSNIPNGTYTITPSIVGPSSVFSPATQSVTVSNNSPTTTFSVALGYTVSGTVSYSGSKTGQIYLTLNNSNCSNNWNYGTSISSAGSFSIRGVPPGTYYLNAFMDNVGQGVANASNPTGSVTNITVVTSGHGGVAVTLTDPTSSTLTAPTLQGVSPMNTAALIAYKPITSNNVELATSYTVQWSTTSTFTNIAGSKTIPATGANGTNIWFVNGLTNGTAYYFRAYGTSPTTSVGPYSSVAGPYTINAPSGANTVTGTVTFSGTATGPMYTGYYDGSTGNFYGEYIANPVSPQAFSVNVPSSSTYFHVAVVDQNNDGADDTGDFADTANLKSFTSVSSSETGQNITLSGSNSTLTSTTQYNHVINGVSTSDSYNLDFALSGIAKLPVGLTLLAGPNVVEPIDLGSCNGTNSNCNGNSAFEFVPSINSTPNVGDTYTFKVTYSDGSTDTLTNSLATVLGSSALATNLAPQTGTSTSTTPTFTWTYPSNPTNYTYNFLLSQTTGNTIWQIPSQNSNSSTFSYSQDTAGSIPWNTDPTGGGSLPSPSSGLTLNTPYQWSIETVDANGNQATVTVYYTP